MAPWRPNVFKSRDKKKDEQSSARSRPGSRHADQDPPRDTFNPQTGEVHPGTRVWTRAELDEANHPGTRVSVPSIAEDRSTGGIRGSQRGSQHRLRDFVFERGDHDDRDDRHSVGVQSSDEEEGEERHRPPTPPERMNRGQQEDHQASFAAGRVNFSNPWVEKKEQGPDRRR